MKTRFLVVGALLVLLAFLAAGCTTSSMEWSGRMSNETGPHVQGYNVNQPNEQQNDSIRPIATALSPIDRLQSRRGRE